VDENNHLFIKDADEKPVTLDMLSEQWLSPFITE
jgi:hypothetical protein